MPVRVEQPPNTASPTSHLRCDHHRRRLEQVGTAGTRKPGRAELVGGNADADRIGHLARLANTLEHQT
jgi:hypothetical protein